MDENGLVDVARRYREAADERARLDLQITAMQDQMDAMVRRYQELGAIMIQLDRDLKNTIMGIPVEESPPAEPEDEEFREDL